DSTGHYTTSASAGSHTVSEVIPTAYIATFPATGSASIIVTGGGTTTQDFADALPVLTLDNGQPGYSEAGPAWSTENDGWNGTSRIHVAGGKGSVKATWTLKEKGSVPHGTYEVFVTYVPSASRGMARYTLFDGDFGHPIGSIVVD